MKKSKLILACMIVSIMVLAYIFNIGQYLNLETLQAQKESILSQYTQHQLMFILGYVAIYILSTAMSLPGAMILTLLGGAIFGTILGALIVGVSATVGATLAFLSARFLLRETLEKKVAHKLAEFNRGVQENALNYVLFLRLVPVFPFFLINIGLGLTRLSLNKYVLGSFLGMIPGTFVYTHAGSQLSQITHLGDILSTEMMLAFALLGGFALVPIAYKKLKKGKNS